MLTKDKLYVLVKMHCEITDGVWKVTDSAAERFDLAGFKFSEVFRGGAAPQFQQSFGRGQFSKNNLLMNKLDDSKSSSNANQSMNKSKSNASASPHANANKKQPPTTNNNNNNNKSKNTTPSKQQNTPTEANGKGKAKQPEVTNQNKSKAKGQANRSETSNVAHAQNGTSKNAPTSANGSLVNKNLKLNDSTDDDSSVVDQDMDEANEFSLKIIQVTFLLLVFI
jgi:hypothetical protein